MMSRELNASSQFQLEEITHFSRNKTAYELTCAHSDEDIPESDLDSLPPLASFTINLTDVVFNSIVLIIILLEFAALISVVAVHYVSGGSWASGISFLFLAFGGIALLKHFWTITHDTLNHVYGRGKLVRVLVNAFPHLALVITSFECTRVCLKCRENPMAIPQYMKLDELSRSFLKIHSFACSAPMAVLQLVCLVVQEETYAFNLKELLLLATIILNLTSMMVGNLPGKYEASDELPKAAYIAGSRVFVGLRMSSSFGSRTMCLAYLLVSFRCIGSEFLSLPEPVSYLIAISILLAPRLLITVVQYIHGRLKGKKRPRRFSSILIGYLATIFFQFGDPPWLFWFTHIETFVYLLFSVVYFFVVECGVTITFNCIYCSLFFILYFVVPCLVPCLRHRARNKS